MTPKILSIHIWVTVFILFIATVVGHSQIQRSRLMLQGCAGSGFDGLLNIGSGLQYSGYEGWGFRLEWRDWRKLAPNTPADFYSGLCVWGECTPTNHAHAMSVMLSKQLRLYRHWLGWGVDAGPTLLYQESQEFIPHPQHAMLESNYIRRSSFNWKGAAGLRIHLDLFASDFWGCSLGFNSLLLRASRHAVDFAMHFSVTNYRGRKPIP